MAKSTNIEQKIKESFESVQHKAPQNLWSTINDGLSDNANDLDIKVKSSFETNTDKAPEGIWESIDKQLTIDKGWMRVHKLLQRRTFFKWTKRVAAFMIFLFFVTPEYGGRLSGSTEELNNNTNYIAAKETEPNTSLDQDKDSRTERLNSESGLDNINDTDFFIKKESYADNNLPTKFSEPSQSDLIQQKEGFPLTKEVISTTEKGGAVSTQDISKSTQKKIEFLAPGLKNEDISKSDLTDLSTLATLPIRSVWSLKSFNENLELIEINIELPKETKVEFGLSTALNTTAIVNNRTRRALDSKSLIAFNPTLGTNMGLQFVYHFKEGHGVVGNLTYANINQSYGSFSNGRFNEEILKTNFVRLQAMYQYKYKRFDISKRALNLKFGPYAGLMTSSRYFVNGEEEKKFVDDLQNYDFGITLQLGQSYEFNKLVLDYGLNMDKGLANLNKGTQKIPASFDRATTLGFGCYVSLRYKF